MYVYIYIYIYKLQSEWIEENILLIESNEHGMAWPRIAKSQRMRKINRKNEMQKIEIHLYIESAHIKTQTHSKKTKSNKFYIVIQLVNR